MREHPVIFSQTNRMKGNKIQDIKFCIKYQRVGFYLHMSCRRDGLCFNHSRLHIKLKLLPPV